MDSVVNQLINMFLQKKFGGMGFGNQPSRSFASMNDKFSSMQRAPIVRPDGVTIYNPLTQEEQDLINHPSVKWMKERANEGREQLLREFEAAPKTQQEAFARMQQYKGEDLTTNMPHKIDPEYARHMDIIGELAKRNPQVLYAAGILDDGVARYSPDQFNKYSDEDLVQNMSNSYPGIIR